MWRFVPSNRSVLALDDASLMSQRRDSRDCNSPCKVFSGQSLWKFHRREVRLILHARVNTLEERCVAWRKIKVSTRKLALTFFAGRTRLRGDAHLGPEVVCLSCRCGRCGRTAWDRESIVTIFVRGQYVVQNGLGRGSLDQSITERRVKPRQSCGMLFSFHELLRILPDLSCVRSEREPQADKVGLFISGTSAKRSNTYKEENTGTGVHQCLDLVLVECIPNGVRVNIIAGVALPSLFGVIRGTAFAVELKLQSAPQANSTHGPVSLVKHRGRKGTNNRHDQHRTSHAC